MTELQRTGTCFVLLSVIAAAFGQQPASQPVPPATRPAASSAAPATPAPGGDPKMTLSILGYDFGSIWDDEKQKFTIKVSNEGAGELKFDAKASCGCIDLQVPRRVLPPGQTVDLPVIFDPLSKQGQTEQTIQFTSNDPALRSHAFVVSGFVKRAILADPYNGVWLRTASGAPGQTPKVVRLNNELAEPMKLTLTANTAPFVDVEIKEVKPGLEYEIITRTKQELKPGRIRGSLIFSTGLSRESNYRVPVVIDVVPPLHVEPRAIMVDNNIAGQPYPVRVLYFGEKKDLQLLRYDATPRQVPVAYSPLAPPIPSWAPFKPPIQLMSTANITVPNPADVPPQGITIRFVPNDGSITPAEVLLTTDRQVFDRVVHGPPEPSVK